MKKRAILLSLFLIFSFTSAQEIIENPEKSLSKNAGRVLELKEVLRITDESGEFYFSRPYNLQIAPNGDLFIQDREQILHFDSKGKYQRNLFRKGQGPGEMISLTRYQLAEESIIIHCVSPSKILKVNYRGNLIEEITINQKEKLDSFQFFYDGQYYLFHIDWRQIDTFEGVVGLPHELLSLSADGEILTKHMTFPTKVVIASQSGIRGGYVPVDRQISAVWMKKYLVISHTEEYLLSLFDAKSQKIVKKFKREYPRVKATEKNDKRPNLRIVFDGKSFQAPKRNYHYDIEQLWVHDNKLWVLTSKTEEGKGYVVDVFDINGIYTDMFYLNLPQAITKEYIGYVQMNISGDFLYASVKDENDLYVIKKYRMY
ncbi:MAG: 6-bladed beta-propeller [Candidatus Aminicenantes bacterium]|nr:6-bladed beta-propeller [Candidatus Aminicenantes bacterium]